MNRFHFHRGHQSVDTGINFSSYLEIVFFCTVHTIYTCIQSMLHHQTLCIYLQKNNCGWCVRLCTDAVEATGRTCWHVSQQHKHTDSRGLSSRGGGHDVRSSIKNLRQSENRAYSGSLSYISPYLRRWARFLIVSSYHLLTYFISYD